jgi:predicted metal-binding protein
MKVEPNAWSKGVCLVCTKCHKAIEPSLLSEGGNAGENLKTYLKKAMKESGKASEIRVVTSSCLDICEPNLQAVVYAAIDGKTETYTVHPEADRNQLLKFLAEK